MKVNFKKDVLSATFHDPRNNFEITTTCCEIRYDPLTGRLSRIFPSKTLKLSRYDWNPAVDHSRRQACPFCPENLERSTPRFTGDFVPGGRIRLGRAVVVPNLSAYESYNGVVVMSPDHYLGMGEITSGALGESLAAGLEFLARASAADPDNARYGSVNWNYMPLAGGSLVHPHLQVVAGRKPSTYAGLLIGKSAAYRRKNGSVFWSDLLEAEEGGPRFLGRTGRVAWLATFAPLGLGDVTAVIPGKAAPGDLGEGDVRDVASGMLKVIGYYDSVNIPAFNSALYLARREDRGFWATLRMVGRFTIHPLGGSDISYIQYLLGDPWTFRLPEEMAAELKKNF